MVRHQHDDRATRMGRRFQRIQDLAYLCIHESHGGEISPYRRFPLTRANHPIRCRHHRYIGYLTTHRRHIIHVFRIVRWCDDGGFLEHVHPRLRNIPGHMRTIEAYRQEKWLVVSFFQLLHRPGGRLVIRRQ